jgi:hypothetical protein
VVRGGAAPVADSRTKSMSTGISTSSTPVTSSPRATPPRVTRPAAISVAPATANLAHEVRTEGDLDQSPIGSTGPDTEPRQLVTWVPAPLPRACHRAQFRQRAGGSL